MLFINFTEHRSSHKYWRDNGGGSTNHHRRNELHSTFTSTAHGHKSLNLLYTRLRNDSTVTENENEDF